MEDEVYDTVRDVVKARVTEVSVPSRLLPI